MRRRPCYICSNGGAAIVARCARFERQYRPQVLQGKLINQAEAAVMENR
jgi:hypothetical protein